MKKSLVAIGFLIGAAVLMTAAAGPQAGPKLVSLDLSKASASFPVIMQAPEGVTAADDFGDVLVKKGANFQVAVSSSAKDIESLKKEIKANPMNKLKAFLVDTADALLYESTVMGKSEFHFAANVKVEATTFGAEDAKGPVYTKAVDLHRKEGA
ncbi:MAG: hypothetical protein NTZ26_03230 [Candidatus Aminicenantes bacterium]|nr:hypothetical protein [Candidatus Aminicenantes bacterium]